MLFKEKGAAQPVLSRLESLLVSVAADSSCSVRLVFVSGRAPIVCRGALGDCLTQDSVVASIFSTCVFQTGPALGKFILKGRVNSVRSYSVADGARYLLEVAHLHRVFLVVSPASSCANIFLRLGSSSCYWNPSSRHRVLLPYGKLTWPNAIIHPNFIIL